jgi:hypothetical protein
MFPSQHDHQNARANKYEHKLGRQRYAKAPLRNEKGFTEQSQRGRPEQRKAQTN